MTPAQHRKYWQLLGQAYSAYSALASGAATREEFRALIHIRAFGKNISAKDIDRMKGFDQFKAACMAIIEPTDLGGQVALENMPKTRLIHRICHDFPASYILCLMNSPRFARCNFGDGSGASRRAGLEDLEHWAEKDLTDLRTTLCARNPSDVKAAVPICPDIPVSAETEGQPF
jgi:hypothetical protein